MVDFVYWHSHFPESFLIFFRSITILYMLLIVFLFVLMRKDVASLSSELEADLDFIQIKNKKIQ